MGSDSEGKWSGVNPARWACPSGAMVVAAVAGEASSTIRRYSVAFVDSLFSCVRQASLALQGSILLLLAWRGRWGGDGVNGAIGDVESWLTPIPEEGDLEAQPPYPALV